MPSSFKWPSQPHHKHLQSYHSSLSLPSLSSFILSGFPWFALCWCHPLPLSTSAVFLSAGCWWPSCCVYSTADGSVLLCGGPGSRKQTSRPASKQTSVVCPYPQLPLPNCWQWKKFPPGKSRTSELYHPWICSCTLSACFVFFFSAKENRRIGKAGDLLRENQHWIFAVCCSCCLSLTTKQDSKLWVLGPVKALRAGR